MTRYKIKIDKFDIPFLIAAIVILVLIFISIVKAL